jgi:predicted  nucleic acid-binding Zn-ribbon protein|tara:strand:+ start:322 stop:537 length:216 start_codon:yes stop_codon:yes gene_type:complete
MARWEWDKETQKEFEKMQEKCREFSMIIDKFREKVTRGVEYMEDIDSTVSKFEYEVDIMEEKFRQMKHNCF